MRRLSYSDAARRDLASILDHISRKSDSAAIGRRFAGQLQQKCRNCASLPGTLGRARPELWPDIRSVASRGYVIFFRYRDDMLEIVNALEGHRDILSYFGEGQD